MATTEESVKCTKCGSTQVHAEKRGWRMTTGFFGSSKIFITCLKCGNKFKPGDAPRYSAYSAEEKHDTQVGLIALAVIVAVGFLLLRACS
jgi:RNase P subunit RPR2